MQRPARELATLIGRVLITASNRTLPTWTPSLEQTLHRLGCRDALTPPLVARVIDTFLLNHHSLALGFFNWASQQPGFSHTSVTYQSILKSLSISRQFSAVDKIIKQVRAQKIDLDASVYQSVISLLIAGKKTQNAFFIFIQVKSLICEIGPQTCNSLLASLSSEGNIDFAQKVFDEMVVRGVSLSTTGFGMFIWRFCRNTELSRTLDLLDEARKSNSMFNGSVVALVVVHGLCLQSRVEDASFILDEFRKRDCKPDFMAYRIVAESFRSMGNVVDVYNVLKKKRKLGVAPRANDYKDFIFTLISERLVSDAKELGKVIVDGNFPIQDDVLNTLIGSVSTVDSCCAVSFLKFMVGKGSFPTLLTLSNLSRNLCKHGKGEEMIEVFQTLSAKNYFVNTERYNMMVSFLCKAGQVKEAYQVIQEMKKKGLDPDVSIYNHLMEACCREDLLRPAKRLWDEMFANGCSGNLTTYNILIQKFSEVGQVEEAHRLFCHMLQKGISPDATTYTFILQGLCQEKEVEMALGIFNKSVEQNLVLAQTILGTFILCLCKEGYFYAASKLLRDGTNNMEHSSAHVILLRFLADSGEVPIAIEHIRWVVDNQPSTWDAICTKFLASLSSSLRPEPILRLFHSLPKHILDSGNDSLKNMLNTLQADYQS